MIILVDYQPQYQYNTRIQSILNIIINVSVRTFFWYRSGALFFLYPSLYSYYSYVREKVYLVLRTWYIGRLKIKDGKLFPGQSPWRLFEAVLQDQGRDIFYPPTGLPMKQVLVGNHYQVITGFQTAPKQYHNLRP